MSSNPSAVPRSVIIGKLHVDWLDRASLYDASCTSCLRAKQDVGL